MSNSLNTRAWPIFCFLLTLSCQAKLSCRVAGVQMNPNILAEHRTEPKLWFLWSWTKLGFTNLGCYGVLSRGFIGSSIHFNHFVCFKVGNNHKFSPNGGAKEFEMFHCLFFATQLLRIEILFRCNLNFFTIQFYRLALWINTLFL